MNTKEGQNLINKILKVEIVFSGLDKKENNFIDKNGNLNIKDVVLVLDISTKVENTKAEVENKL